MKSFTTVVSVSCAATTEPNFAIILLKPSVKITVSHKTSQQLELLSKMESLNGEIEPSSKQVAQ